MWKLHTRVTTKICWMCIIRAFRIEFMCIFAVWKLFSTCGAGDDVSYVRFGETKDRYFNRSLRHGTEICVLIRFGTYRFHRYRCRVGTGFRYPNLVFGSSISLANMWVFLFQKQNCYHFATLKCHLAFQLWCNSIDKRIVHPKIKMLSLITHSHVVSNP